LLDLLQLVAGLAILVGGGEMMVRGASALARLLGVSPLVIGLTVVAFGTSAPELAVNGLAALQGSTELSFGNIIGSNIANIALILGSMALIRPLEVESSVVSREIPMMLLATAAVIVLGSDRIRGGIEGYDRYDGLILLLFFSVFLYYTLAEVLRRRATDPLFAQASQLGGPTRLHSFAPSALLMAGGLAGLSGGAQLTVNAAVALAEALSIPSVVVGLTLVAFGTSLPELATSLVAVRRGQVELAVGNVVGSNLFNLLFILAVTSVLEPIPLPAGGHFDLGVMALLSVALLFVANTHGRRIVRIEAALLLTIYFSFILRRVALAL
jgi:cation:H+ antiporter